RNWSSPGAKADHVTAYIVTRQAAPSTKTAAAPDVVRGQFLSGQQGTHRHQSTRHEHHIGAVPHDFGLAELEGVVVLVEHGGYLAAQEAQMGRTVVCGQLRHGLCDID